MHININKYIHFTNLAIQANHFSALSLSAVAAELRSAAVVAPHRLPPRRHLLQVRRILADLTHLSVCADANAATADRAAPPPPLRRLASPLPPVVSRGPRLLSLPPLSPPLAARGRRRRHRRRGAAAAGAAAWPPCAEWLAGRRRRRAGCATWPTTPL